jgi:hypothetical protein
VERKGLKKKNQPVKVQGTNLGKGRIFLREENQE